MKKGYFGDFGGQFIPELLMPPLIELEEAMETILPSEAFQSRFAAMLKENVGRPSAITYCPNLSRDLGLDLWLKREDLNHSGAHKINNTLGQGLLAKMMGKKVLLAETGAGMHGVATTVAAAMLDMKAVIYMGATDVVRQAPNVNRMRLMGAEIIAVESGTKTLKDAINEALRRWLSDQETTHYCFGTAAGPHPFPTLVREFQQIISKEAREQFMTRNQGKLPDVVVACVGGGSNAIGMFHNFVPDESVKLVGVEAAGTGEPGCYSSAPIDHGTDGVLHGMKTKLLQTPEGQIEPSHSVAAGLDYPGVGPEHAHLHAIGRVDYTTINDTQAINAFKVLSRREGIIPALESSHAVAYAIENRDKLQGQSVLVCLSGRGDKDLGILDEIL
jgi:tryptophan synthase beta chain